MSLPHFETEALLRDIRIEPARVEREKMPEGGPIWPEDTQYSFLRNMRGNKPVGTLPKPGPDVAESIDMPAVWCGYAVNHFGHFIAEQAPRIIAAIRKRPNDLYLFLAPPRLTEKTLPSWFWDILSWYGVPRAQVRILTDKPVLVRTLRVFPQAEHLVVGPGAEYLDALDQICARHMPDVARDLEHVYVSRAGMGTGKLGGEGYLEQQLLAAGVKVVRPEALSLRDQLSIYARARTLIFAEGSAAHGRQLLGRIKQHIVVVSRRKGWAFAGALLRPRAEQLTHIDALHGSIHFSFEPNGQPRRWQAFAFVKGHALVRQFEMQGIVFRGNWNNAEFEAAQAADMQEWATIVSRACRPEDLDQRIRLLQGAFLAIGQENKATPLIQIARDVAESQPRK